MSCQDVKQMRLRIPISPNGYSVPLLYRLEPAENVTKLLERIRALQDENNKLSRELSEAAGQTAFMFEKIIMVSQT